MIRSRSHGFAAKNLLWVLVFLVVIGSVYGLIQYMGKSERNKQICIDNLQEIEAAKEKWATAKRTGPLPPGPYIEDIVKPDVPGFLKAMPVCPDGGTYTIGDMSLRPMCSLEESLGHKVPSGAGGGGL